MITVMSFAEQPKADKHINSANFSLLMDAAASSIGYAGFCRKPDLSAGTPQPR